MAHSGTQVTPVTFETECNRCGLHFAVPIDRFKDPQYVNFVAAILGLQYLKEGLERTIKITSEEFYDGMKQDIENATACSQCDFSVTGDDKPNSPSKCPLRVCGNFKQAIECHTTSCIDWKCAPCDDITSPATLVAIYLPSFMMSSYTSPEKADMSAFLSLFEWCVPFKNKIADMQRVYKVRESRNAIMHSGTMKIDTPELKRHMDNYIALLEDKQQLKGDDKCKEAIDKIKKICGADIQMKLLKEVEQGVLDEVGRSNDLKMDEIRQKLESNECSIEETKTVKKEVLEIKERQAKLKVLQEVYDLDTSDVDRRKIKCNTLFEDVERCIENKLHENDKAELTDLKQRLNEEINKSAKLQESEKNLRQSQQRQEEQIRDLKACLEEEKHKSTILEQLCQTGKINTEILQDELENKHAQEIQLDKHITILPKNVSEVKRIRTVEQPNKLAASIPQEAVADAPPYSTNEKNISTDQHQKRPTAATNAVAKMNAAEQNIGSIYYKATDSMPSGWDMIGMNVVDGVANSVTSSLEQGPSIGQSVSEGTRDAYELAAACVEVDGYRYVVEGVFAKENEATAAEKREMTKKSYDELEKVVKKAEDSSYKATDSMPSGWDMIGMNVVEGVANSVTSSLDEDVNSIAFGASRKKESKGKQNKAGNSEGVQGPSIGQSVSEGTRDAYYLAITLQVLIDKLAAACVEVDGNLKMSLNQNIEMINFIEELFSTCLQEARGIAAAKSDVKDRVVALCLNGANVCVEVREMSHSKHYNAEDTKALAEKIMTLQEHVMSLSNERNSIIGNIPTAIKSPNQRPMTMEGKENASRWDMIDMNVVEGVFAKENEATDAEQKMIQELHDEFDKAFTEFLVSKSLFEGVANSVISSVAEAVEGVANSVISSVGEAVNSLTFGALRKKKRSRKGNTTN